MKKVKIVTTARSWIGTRFHHLGRVKKSKDSKGGCDCVGLLVGVSKELGLTSKHNTAFHLLDRTGYARNSSSNILEQILRDNLYQKTITEAAIADVILFNINNNFQHIGIISEIADENIYIIHASLQARKVVEHLLDKEWREKIVSIFSFFK